MKPQNKHQEQILQFSKELGHNLSEIELNYGFDKAFKKRGVMNAKGLITCLECGHTYQRPTGYLCISVTGSVCEKCNNKLQVKQTRTRSFKECSYYTLIHNYKGNQVIRTFQIDKIMSKGIACERKTFEVYQLWISKEMTITSVGCYSGSRYYDIWSGDFEIRDYRYSHTDYLAVGNTIYNKASIIPELRQRGISLRNLFINNPSTLIIKTIENSNFETLVKSKRNDILKTITHSEITQFWPAIKQAIKHKYKMNVRTWFDYLSMLKTEEKDIRNPKIILPKDLAFEHDKIANSIRKKNNIRAAKIAKENEIKRALENKKDNEEYILKKQKFFELEIEHKGIYIAPLKSIDDFIQEANIHKHCVFGAKYYKKEDSLCLKAVVNGVNVETIEFSLKDFSVKQSRGKHNQPTEYHKDILEAIEINTNRIKKIHYSKTT